MKINPDWLQLPQTQKLINAFAKYGKQQELRFVGGAVRDGLLGIKVEDVDAATTLTPEEVSKLLEKEQILVIPTGIKHGTVTAIIDKRNFEITTLRHDTFCDGRHAQVSFTDNWQGDAARRDFTINSLYLAVDGELFDYFGGIEDLRAGRIRFIGEAKERIKEDYLRILRFFRFFAYYGKEEIDKDGLYACSFLADGINNLSGERIQQEMLKLLAAPRAHRALELMGRSGILTQIFGFSLRHIPPSVNELGSADLRLTLLLLSAGIPSTEALKIMAKRWRISGGLEKLLNSIISQINSVAEGLDIAGQQRLIRALGAEIFSAIVTIKQALEPSESYQKMLSLAQNWQIPTFPLKGDDLIELGIAEGRELGQILKKLEKSWEESDYKLSKEELIKMI